MTFRVGQKVVCISAEYQRNAPPPYPVVGTVATVSWVGIIAEHIDRDDNGLSIDLVEFPSPETNDYWRGYRAMDWRPIVERKTDITIFTEILRKSSKKIGERV